MDINQLPPEMLVTILKASKVFLKKYIQLRAVSPHWLSVIELHVLGKKTELGIYDGSGYLKGDRLPVPPTDEHTQLIARLLPAVTSLNIYLNNVRSLSAQLPLLISLYSSTLTTLSLIFVGFDDQHDDQLTQAVCDAINSLTKLSSLKLRPYYHSSPPMLLSLGPTLARLQQFAYRPEGDLEKYDRIFTSDKPLVNLTDLHMEGRTRITNSVVADIVATFPSLQNLSLEYRFGNNPGNILRHLSSLEHLSELELKIEVQKLHFEDEDVDEDDDEIARHLMPSPTDRPLAGVKKLNLYFFNEFDEQDHLVHAAVLSLVAWFPNLTSLFFDTFDDGEFKLTDAFLGRLARLKHLTELKLPYYCFWERRFSGPTGRPLTSVTKLKLNFPESDFKVEHFAPLVAWFPQLKDLRIIALSYHHCFLTTAMLRDLSRLEQLTNFKSEGLHIKRDQLILPSSTDRPLVNVKELNLELSTVYDSLDSTEEEDSAGERPVLSEYICEVIVAWFPNLTVLKINVWEFENDKLALTSTMLRLFARLESLTWLYLETLLYKKEHLSLPSSTDRPLTSLKELKLEFADCPFDVPYFGQTLAAWFPCLEELRIVADDKLKCFIEENRHHFGSSIRVIFCSP